MKENLKSEMKVAMKAKDKIRLSTIRAILSAIQYEEMQKGVDSLSEQATLAILKAEGKKRKESLEFAEKAGRESEIEEIKSELAVIDSFLPSQLTEEELRKIVTDLKNSQPDANMGVVMKILKDKYPGQYDGKLASGLAKEIVG